LHYELVLLAKEVASAEIAKAEGALPSGLRGKGDVFSLTSEALTPAASTSDGSTIQRTAETCHGTQSGVQAWQINLHDRLMPSDGPKGGSNVIFKSGSIF
jgi:hypothetical protein